MNIDLGEMRVSVGALTLCGWAADRLVIESRFDDQRTIHSLSEAEARQLYIDLERLLSERD